jgi:LysM repeat protein
MVGRSPARFLAPLALVGFAVALVMVVGASSSSNGDGEPPATPVERQTSTDEGQTTEPAKTAEPKSSTKTYTIKPGDTPSGIASANGMTTERLLELNPGLDPTAMTVGERVKIE